MKKISSVLGICGACISFYIGAGFATMQEVLQYETSYGSKFPIVIIVAAIIYVYTNISFATNGNALNLSRGNDIYEVYFAIFGRNVGKILAFFYDKFSVIFCFMSFVVMCGGASSTLNQQWKIPLVAGAVVLTILVVLTVILGLDGIISALSKIGPIIVIMILFVSTATVILGCKAYAENVMLIDQGKFQSLIKQVGGENPIASGSSYGGFVILWFAAFIAEIGSKNKLNEVNIGMLLSSVFIFLTSAICCIALISNIDLVAIADIPALILAEQIHHFVAVIFAIIICAGIYTSATPLLWIVVRSVSEEGTIKYKVVTILLGCVGCLIACFIPYKGLINIIYGVNGYLGFLLVFVMIIHDVKLGCKKMRLK